MRLNWDEKWAVIPQRNHWRKFAEDALGLEGKQWQNEKEEQDRWDAGHFRVSVTLPLPLEVLPEDFPSGSQ
jgi:hypothetical protein